MATNVILTNPPQTGNNSPLRPNDRQTLILARAALAYIDRGEPLAVTFDKTDVNLAIDRLGEILKEMGGVIQ